MNTFFEIVGYAASVLVAISLAVGSTVRFRVLNLAGSLTFVAYGLLIASYPVAAVNLLIAGINVHKLRGLLAGSGPGRAAGLPRPIALADVAERLEGPYRPMIVAELNGQHLKLARLEGPFDWHAHPEADELFWVLEGRFRMEFRDGAVEVAEGEVLVVPRGVEHRPVSEGETLVALFEPAGTRNTGDRVTGRTVQDPARF